MAGKNKWKADILEMEQEINQMEENGAQMEGSKIHFYYFMLGEKYAERRRELHEAVEQIRKITEENKMLKKELDKTKEELDKTKEELDKTKEELDKRKEETYKILQKESTLQMEMKNVTERHAKEMQELQLSVASTIVSEAIEDCEFLFLRGSTDTPSIMYKINDLMNSTNFDLNALGKVKFANTTVEKVLEILLRKEIGHSIMEKQKRRFGKHYLNFLFGILFSRFKCADDLRKALEEPEDPSNEEKLTKYADEVYYFCTSMDLIYKNTSNWIHHSKNHMANKEVVEILRHFDIVPRPTLRAVEQLLTVVR